MIDRVICQCVSVFCKWWSVACYCRGLPSSLEKEFYHFPRSLLGKLYVRVLSVEMFVKGVDLVFVYGGKGIVNVT